VPARSVFFYMSGTYTLPPYGGEEDPSFEVPVVTEGYHPSLHYNNQMYETTQSTDLTGDYSRTAGTSSESAEDSNPEGHPAGEDGIDFHYGEPVLQGFHTSNPAGSPAGEQVLTGYYGARNPSNMSPIPSLTLVVVLELLGFILQCLLGCRAGGVHRCTLHVHLLSVFNLPVHP
jgi:hypothetical protein